jgi:hypothetical protein
VTCLAVCFFAEGILIKSYAKARGFTSMAVMRGAVAKEQNAAHGVVLVVDCRSASGDQNSAESAGRLS